MIINKDTLNKMTPFKFTTCMGLLLMYPCLVVLILVGVGAYYYDPIFTEVLMPMALVNLAYAISYVCMVLALISVIIYVHWLRTPDVLSKCG